MIKNVLKEKQKVVYHILENAFNNDRLAHAYMFVGTKGSYIKETAYLLAQSLVCENGDPLACETCETCRRIADSNYADMIYLDGEAGSIKKEDIINLKNEFSKTNNEVKGRKIYIINRADNCTDNALNSLLTFLEEPSSDAIAILLVENLENVLDTIKSRTQIIKFKNINKEECYNIIKDEYDKLDAYMLSNLVSDINIIKEVSESEIYQHALYIFKDFITKFADKDLLYKISLYNDGFPKGNKNNKEIFDYFLRMCEVCAKDTMLNNQFEDNWYNEICHKLKYEEALHMISVCNNLKDRNIKGANFNLLIDQFLYEMEGKYERN